MNRSLIRIVKFFLVTIILSGNTYSNTENRFYTSAGLRLGYEFGGPITFTLKTGAGYYQRLIPREDDVEAYPFKNFESFSLGYR